jgi:hypothetical protein
MDRRAAVLAVASFITLVASALALEHLCLPPFWGNPNLSHKVAFVDHHGSTYDRVFIGSSHIYHQLDPALFDSLMGDGSRSFNMAFSASYAPEAELACEHLLERPGPALRAIYLEVSPYLKLTDTNLVSCRNWYMVGPRVWWSLVGQAWGMNLSRTERLPYVQGANRAFINATFLPGLWDQLSQSEVKDSTLLMGDRGNGFITLDREFEITGREDLARRRKALAQDTGQLYNHVQQIIQQYTIPELRGWPGKPYVALMEKLVKLGDERGVKVYFILPPMINGPEALAVFKALPADRQIDVCDPRRFPALYHFANVFDRGHLNARGSRLFTQALANEVKERRTTAAIGDR